MNTRKVLSTFLGLLFAAALFTACEDVEPMTSLSFSSTIEGLVDSDTTANGTKLYLHNEKWIYWEDGDIISIGSNTSEGSVLNYMAQLANINAGFINDPDGDWKDFNGLFITSLPEGSRYFLGLHPYNQNNNIRPAGTNSSDFSTVQIVLPSEQPATSDLTFARDVFPMVAWYGGSWDANQPSTPFNLDFHSLAGLVRLQFFAPTDKELTSIQVQENTGKALAGTFNVRDYKTHYPYLEAVSGSTTNTITMPCGRTIEADNGTVTCYLVLPATTSLNGYTNYDLNVTISAGGKTYIGRVTFWVRRNGITYLRAIELQESEVSEGLVGDGTSERPYKIYSVGDLLYVRAAFGVPGDDVYINGKLVTAETEFHIMRNDIYLTPDNWNGGIPNFKGRMLFKAQTASNAGIINVSNAPIFESVGPDGIVEDLPVRAANQYSDASEYSAGEIFSPIVHTNHGIIANCRILDCDPDTYANLVQDVKSAPRGQKSGSLQYHGQGVQSVRRHLAGICAVNRGLITGCNSEASYTAENGNVAGICYNNYGTVRNCAAATPMFVNLANGLPGHMGSVAGICQENFEGAYIYDSYFTMNQTTGNDFRWFGIAGGNDGTIEHCYTSATAVITTSGEFYGICGYNLLGTIDYCYFQGRVIAPMMAGIALHNSNVIRNSYVLGAQMIFPDNQPGQCYAGGLVRENVDGTIENCFLYAPRILKPNPNANSFCAGALVYEHAGGQVRNSYVFQTGTPIDPLVYQYGGVDPNTVYQGCFHVGPATAPTGVTVKTSSTASEMLAPLNAGRGADGAEWELTTVGGVSIPVLKPYTRNIPDPYPVITKGRKWARR